MRLISRGFHALPRLLKNVSPIKTWWYSRVETESSALESEITCSLSLVFEDEMWRKYNSVFGFGRLDENDSQLFVQIKFSPDKNNRQPPHTCLLTFRSSSAAPDVGRVTVLTRKVGLVVYGTCFAFRRRQIYSSRWWKLLADWLGFRIQFALCWSVEWRVDMWNFQNFYCDLALRLNDGVQLSTLIDLSINEVSKTDFRCCA